MCCITQLKESVCCCPHLDAHAANSSTQPGNMLRGQWRAAERLQRLLAAGSVLLQAGQPAASLVQEPSSAKGI